MILLTLSIKRRGTGYKLFALDSFTFRMSRIEVFVIVPPRIAEAIVNASCSMNVRGIAEIKIRGDRSHKKRRMVFPSKCRLIFPQ